MKKKVILVIGTSSGGEFVREYLTETIKTMDILPDPKRTIVVRTAKNQVTPDEEILDPSLLISLQSFVERLSGER